MIVGVPHPPSPSEAINATTPDIVTVTVTNTPTPTPLSTQTGWQYCPEKGYYCVQPPALVKI